LSRNIILFADNRNRNLLSSFAMFRSFSATFSSLPKVHPQMVFQNKDTKIRAWLLDYP